MISYKDVGVGPHSNYDTNSEVGVTSVITPLSIRRGAGGEAFCECGYCKENSNHERRKALVSLKRTPFLLVEEALLALY